MSRYGYCETTHCFDFEFCGSWISRVGEDGEQGEEKVVAWVKEEVVAWEAP